MSAIYSREVESHYSPISKEEQTELFTRYKEHGDRKAYNRIYKSVLKSVLHIAGKYKGRGVEFDDLVQTGNLAIARAIEEFDHTSGNKFFSYAVWWIRQAILNELAEQGNNLKLTGSKKQQIYIINKATKKLEQKLHRKPNLKELSKETKISESEIDLLTFTTNETSLNAPIHEEGKSVIDSIPDNKFNSPESFALDAIKEKIIKEIEDAKLDRYPNGELIFKLYYGFQNNVSHNLSEIGERLNRSRERIRQIHNDCLKQFRKYNDIRRQKNEFHLTPTTI